MTQIKTTTTTKYGLLDTAPSDSAALLLQIRMLSSTICFEWQGPGVPDTAFPPQGHFILLTFSFCGLIIPIQTEMDPDINKLFECNNILSSIRHRLYLSTFCFQAEL